MDSTKRRHLERLCLLLLALVLVSAIAPCRSAYPDRSGARRIVQPASTWASPGTPPPDGYSPSQIRHAYGIDRIGEDGAGQIIAIVSVGDNSAIPPEVLQFIEAYHLPRLNGLPGTPGCSVRDGPHPCLQIVGAPGRPSRQGRWVTETCLNVDWAHAIAPGADLLVVESVREDVMDMLDAVDLAVRRGARVVAMSWGGPEFPDEALYDPHFRRPGVAFVAATGDEGGVVEWPASSPYVISVGGSTLRLDRNGNVLSDRAWREAGWGYSAYEPEPAYQASAEIPDPQHRRAVPDVAYAADPEFGFAVYDPDSPMADAGWLELGGTSVGVPQWAGVIALIDQRRPSHPLSSDNLESSPIYNAAKGPLHWINFRPADVAPVSFDRATGLGAPRVDRLVRSLAASQGTSPIR